MNIKNEQDFIDNLSSIPVESTEPNFDLLSDTFREDLDSKVTELETFLSENIDFQSYTEEEKNEMFSHAVEIWNSFQEIVKTQATCDINFTGIELSTISKMLHQNVEYNAESIFYGTYVKKTFLSEVPKKLNKYTEYMIPIKFSDSVAIYSLLSTCIVKGLSETTFAYAKALHRLSEISAIYSYYDKVSGDMDKSIQMWNMELSKDSAAELEKEVLQETVIDINQENTPKVNG